MFCCYFDSLEGNAWDEAVPTWERGSKNMKSHSMMSTMDNIGIVNFSDITMIDSYTCKGIQHRLVYYQFLLGEKFGFFLLYHLVKTRYLGASVVQKDHPTSSLSLLGPAKFLGGK